MKTIDDWLKRTGVPKTRLGLLACANPRAVDRIRKGTARVGTLDAVLRYIEDNPIPHVPPRVRGRRKPQ